MFRHVVLFKWSDQAAPADREAAVAALHQWARDAADLGRVTVGQDAGIREGNFDVAVVAEFAGRSDYERYAGDERHLAMIAAHITPNAASRAAVQHEL